MKVLLINGSPRKNGCTAYALQEAEGVLNASGIDTEMIHIGTDPVRGCTACKRCVGHPNRCTYSDDIVNTVIEKSFSCDGLIVGSPVYYASANGALTAVLDRVFYAGNGFEYKPGAAIVSARRAGTTAALDQLNKYFMISNMPVVSSQYWNMVHGSKAEDVRQDEEGLQIVRTLARNMAWLLNCIEAGKNNGIPLPEKEMKLRTNFIR